MSEAIEAAATEAVESSESVSEETSSENLEAIEGGAEEAAEEAASEELAEESAEESEEESSEESEESTEEEAKQLLKTLKLKIDGKEVEETIDLSDEDYLAKQLQLAKVAQKRMQEKAELEKEFNGEVQRLLDNPWEVLQELGLDPDALAEARIQAKIEEMQKSPEQLEQERMQKELEDLRKKLKAEEEAKQQAEFERLQQEAAQQLEDDIEGALSSTTNLPKSPYVVKRIADAMLWAMDNGYDDVKVEDVVPLVENEVKGELQQLFDEVPEQFLEQLLGKRNVDRLRKSRLSKMKTNTTSNIKPTGNDVKESEESKKDAKKIRMNDFLRGRY